MQQIAPVPHPEPEATQAPVAQPAKVRRRHYGLMVSFLFGVIAPTLLSMCYLSFLAADQYDSTLGFSVRAEDSQSAIDILGGLGDLSSGSSSDTDILYEYIQSQQLVQKINSYLDLGTLFSRPEDDFVFRYNTDGTIEDLVKYWNRMVRIAYDAGNGMIELNVRAFTAEDAQKIAEAVLNESTLVINELTEIARLDTTKYALTELENSQEALRDVRQELTAFRAANNIIDPSTELTVRTGLLNALQQQYSDALIELDLLLETTRAGDPRVSQAERKIEVIEERLTDERRKIGTAGSVGLGGETLTNLVSEFERLSVDLTFAQEAYLSARTSYEAKLADAERQSRYLAPHIRPTLAEAPQFPRLLLSTSLVFLICFLAWSVLTLVYYSLRDRR